MKVMARRKLLYGALYDAGDVFECNDIQQINTWRATGAASLMGEEIPKEKTGSAEDEAKNDAGNEASAEQPASKREPRKAK